MNILAIDDNPDNLTVLAAVASDRLPGVKVLTAPDGPKGLELAAARDPDVILLDIVMPGMDGYAVCRKLKADARLKTIPVLFLTALKADPNIRVKALEAGAEGFLTKPLDEIELVAQVKAMAKIKAAAILQRDERQRLAAMVEERTRALQLSQTSTLNLLEDLKAEIEARKTSSAALRESEERYRILFDRANDGICIMAKDGVLLSVNDSFARMHGYTVKDMQGLTLKDLDTPASARLIPARMARLFAGEALVFEVEHYHKAGHVFPLEVSASLITFGTESFLQCFHRDITERKKAEAYRDMGLEVLQILNETHDQPASIQRVIAALKMRTGFDAVGIRLQDGEDFPYFEEEGFSKDFLLTENTLIERGAEGGICRDKDGNVCLECTCGLVISGKTDPANPLFTRGGSCWTNDSSPLLTLPADQDPRLHPRNQCIHHGYASIALVPIRNKDRIVGLVHLNDRRKGCFTLETVEILEGIASHIGSALINKRAEEAKAKLESELRQAQKMESVGRLAGGVAHDFNNMLMGIMGYAEMCRDEIGPDHPIRGWLNEITTAAERSAKLTQQLLAFARKQIIAPKVLDINDAIENMLKLLRRLIGEDITINWRRSTEIWPVKMDPAQIDQILVNLAVNARDAIAGVGAIVIETRNTTLDPATCSEHSGVRPGDYALLTISDTGCGMDRETLEHLFEPFFTTKGMGQGTGLGLATVYGIVKQNNAFITVDSEAGKGATFKIYFPRFIAPEAEQAAAATPAEPPRGNETVLLVEDEGSVRIITHRFLTGLGYAVLVAENPAEALRLVAGHPGEIQLLITDVVMPGMSGSGLANRLLELRPAIKSLFISGFTADIIVQRGVLEDGVNFLPKPFGRDELARKVRDVLDA